MTLNGNVLKVTPLGTKEKVMLANVYQIPKTAKFKVTKEVRQLPPKRVPNKSVRAREYLTTHEIEDLRKAARGIGRQGHRDDTLVLILFRHAFRVSEIISLRWEQVDLKLGLLHVQRIKNGIPSTHPLRGLELRALRQLKRDNPCRPMCL